MVLNYACLCDSSAPLISVWIASIQLYFLQTMSSNTAASQQNHPWQSTFAQGSGKKDVEDRSGPWVSKEFLSIIPAGMEYTSEKGKYAQLVPLIGPQRPYISELFQHKGKTDMVKYPRYLDEPKVTCDCGVGIFLSRIPWQSGCGKCRVLGWIENNVIFVCMFLFLVFICFELKYYY